MIGHRVILGIMLCGMIFSSLVGCTGASTTEMWIVFPERDAKQMGIGTWLSSDAAFGGFWTPTEGDILSLEGKLDFFLRQNAESFNRQPPAWERLNDYKRQYVGVIIDEKQVIYGNFFCSDTGTDWNKEWVFVLDGGDCFFQLQFDVESRTFTGLTVNGEA